jgi:hypothetical protein
MIRTTVGQAERISVLEKGAVSALLDVEDMLAALDGQIDSEHDQENGGKRKDDHPRHPSASPAEGEPQVKDQPVHEPGDQ